MLGRRTERRRGLTLVGHGSAPLGILLELLLEHLDEAAEEVDVYVLAQLVEAEPVADVAPGQDVAEAAPDLVVVAVPDGAVDDVEAELVEEEREDAEGEVAEGDDEDEGQVEPDGQVDLLVDDVLAEHAHAVVVLLAAGRADVGHGTADLGGEDGAERAHAHLALGLRLVVVLDRVQPVVAELVLNRVSRNKKLKVITF